MTDVIDISADDIAPSSSKPDTAPLRCQYDGCPNTVVKPSRGRTPKFCPEHRQAGSGKNGTPRSKWANADNVEKILSGYLDTLAMGVTLINPADGAVIASGSNAVAHELVELGRVDKTVRKWLEKLSTPGKYGPLTLALFPIVLGIMANHNLLPQFMIPGLTEGRKA